MDILIKCSTGKITAFFESGTSTLKRRLKGSKHLLRKPPSICFDEGIIRQAERFECKAIEVTDTESSRVYRVPFSTFTEKAFQLNYGFGQQLALPIRYWSTDGGEAWQVLKPEPIAHPEQLSQEPHIKQLSLF